MSALYVEQVGKAYKRYPGKWARAAEWLTGRPRHNQTWVLRDICLRVAPGESLGILGVNGAGKSTLLKIITGTTQPTTGRVRIQGRVAALLELGMGFHPDFTGTQNAFMAGQLLGLGREEVAACLPAIAAFAAIGDYLDRPVRTYSSGMQMRLAFSVATAVRPDILIVDEALAVGDAYFAAKCYQRIADFKAQGTTLLLVSHGAEEIVKHCERAILLRRGRIAADGPARVVTNRYLDELFGKTGGREGEPVTAEAGVGAGPLLPGLADAFHTRPGYHAAEHRWGQGGAAILDYLIVAAGQEYPAQIAGNAQTDFYVKVRFDRDFPEVVPGLLIKTLEGIFLYGTNSFIASAGRVRLAARAGEVRRFRFSLPLALNAGYYRLSFGISAGDPLAELTPLDRRYDAVLIQCGRELPFWGLADLGASFDELPGGTVARTTRGIIAP